MFSWPPLLQLLAHVQLVAQQESQAFLCRAARQPASAQPVQVQGVIPSQNFTFVLGKLNKVVVDPIHHLMKVYIMFMVQKVPRLNTEITR